MREIDIQGVSRLWDTEEKYLIYYTFLLHLIIDIIVFLKVSHTGIHRLLKSCLPQLGVELTTCEKKNI